MDHKKDYEVERSVSLLSSVELPLHAMFLLILDFILIATFLVTTYLIQKIFIYLGLANDGVWIGIFDIVSSIAHILFIILVSISFIVSFKHSKTKLVRRRIPK